MKNLTKGQQCVLVLLCTLGFLAPSLLGSLWSQLASDLSTEDFVRGEKVIYVSRIVLFLLGWAGLTFAMKKWEKGELHKSYHILMSLLVPLLVVLTAFQWSLSKETVDQAELSSWLSVYDPFLAQEDGRLSFTYRRVEGYVGALSLQRRSGENPVIDTATAGAAKYIQGEEPSELRDDWLGLALRDDLLSLDQIDQETILTATEELMEKLTRERNRYIGVVMPMYGFERALLQVQLAAGSGKLPLEDREFLADKILAGLAWEVRGEGPDEWLERREYPEPRQLSLPLIRAAVDSLIALDATEALDEASELVLEALENCYRPTDDSGVAGFLTFAAAGGAEDTSERFLGSVSNADADAFFLMERYGFPASVDIPALHKHFINGSTDRTHSDGYPEGCHVADAYLAAALRFRLEQLHPEL